MTARRMEAIVTMHDDPDGLRFEMSTRNQSLQRLRDWPGLPAELGWLSGGVFDAWLTLRQASHQAPALEFQLDVAGLDFDSPAGAYAGAALQMVLTGAWPDVGTESASLRGSLHGG
mgnify:FL=1